MSKERPNPQHILEKFGVDVHLADRLKTYLQSVGDPTAVSYFAVREWPSVAPDLCEEGLRWTLTKTDERVGTLGTLWKSKGVCISSRSFQNGEHDVEIYFTGELKDLVSKPKELASKEFSRAEGMTGWIDINSSPIFGNFYSALQTQREMMREHFGSPTNDLSLEEKVQLAMMLAKPMPDYRYGIGNATGIEGRVDRTILNIAF